MTHISDTPVNTVQTTSYNTIRENIKDDTGEIIDMNVSSGGQKETNLDDLETEVAEYNPIPRDEMFSEYISTALSDIQNQTVEISNVEDYVNGKLSSPRPFEVEAQYNFPSKEDFTEDYKERRAASVEKELYDFFEKNPILKNDRASIKIQTDGFVGIRKQFYEVCKKDLEDCIKNKPDDKETIENLKTKVECLKIDIDAYNRAGTNMIKKLENDAEKQNNDDDNEGVKITNVGVNINLIKDEYHVNINGEF